MRSYKCDGRTFWGFDKDFSKPHRLALCQDEDTTDVWALDEEDITESVDQLLRYFTASDSQQKLIGTYREEGFLGFRAADKFVSRISRFADKPETKFGHMGISGTANA